METKTNIQDIFMIILLSIVLGQSVRGQDCSPAAVRKFDSNIADMLTIGIPHKNFPETKGKDLKKYCNESSVYAFEMDRYRIRCLKGAAKQIYGVIIYAIKSAVKQLCAKGSKRLDRLLPVTPCLNKGSAEIGICNTRLIDSLLGTQNEPDDKKKIPLLCCEYFKSIVCIENRLKRVKECDDEKISLSLDFVRSITGNFVDIACGDYSEGSDKCVKLGPPPKKRKDQRRTKSSILPMIGLLESFEEV